jgi:hypothetical protein
MYWQQPLLHVFSFLWTRHMPLLCVPDKDNVLKAIAFPPAHQSSSSNETSYKNITNESMSSSNETSYTNIININN